MLNNKIGEFQIDNLKISEIKKLKIKNFISGIPYMHDVHLT